MKFSFNMLYFIKKQYFKTQLINTEHRTQDTDTGLRTQTHAKNILTFGSLDFKNETSVVKSNQANRTFRF